MKRNYFSSCLSAAVLTVSSMPIVHAEGDAVVYAPSRLPASSAQQVLAAKPFTNPLPPPDASGIPADTTAAVPYTPGVMTQDGPLDVGSGGGGGGGVTTSAYGSFGIPYTTTRVQYGNQSAAGTSAATFLSTTFPYRTIGKLTFTVGSGSGWCSASLIRRSVIVTAAHCIQKFGSGSNTYSSWKFYPGHYGAAGATAAQIAPHGIWNWSAHVRSSRWSGGTDVGCGSARDNDLAVIALQKNANGQFIGDIVGYMTYGWNNYSFVSSSKTGNLPTAAVSTLGYPALMDSGAIMQRTDGPTYTTTVCNAGQLWQGSNLTGGSSGGPWVVNFSGRNATLSGGAVVGSASNMAVVGVTSWGSADPNASKDNYSSQFRQNSAYPNASYGSYGAGNIGSLLNTLCTSAAPGGGTYASQGYCN